MPIGSREVTLDVTPNREIKCKCWVSADWPQKAQIGLLEKNPEVEFNGEGGDRHEVHAENGKNSFTADASGKIRVIIEHRVDGNLPWRGSRIMANLGPDSTSGTQYWEIKSEDGGGQGQEDTEGNDCELELTWTK